MTDQSFALLSVRMFAAGTKLRTGASPDDYTAVEELTAGESIYDPINGRFYDIADMHVGTLDRAKARAQGMDMYHIARQGMNAAPVTCMIESRNLARQPTIHSPEDAEAVFYGLRFGARVVVDTGAALCEMR